MFRPEHPPCRRHRSHPEGAAAVAGPAPVPEAAPPRLTLQLPAADKRVSVLFLPVQ